MLRVYVAYEAKGAELPVATARTLGEMGDILGISSAMVSRCVSGVCAVCKNNKLNTPITIQRVVLTDKDEEDLRLDLYERADVRG